MWLILNIFFKNSIVNSDKQCRYSTSCPLERMKWEKKKSEKMQLWIQRKTLNPNRHISYGGRGRWDAAKFFFLFSGFDFHATSFCFLLESTLLLL